MPYRRELALRFGAAAALDPRDPGLEERIMEMTGGRGADAVIVAASAPGIVEQAVRYSRPGSRILLFAQTSHQERVELSGADIWSAPFLAPTAPRWIFRNSPLTWFSAAHCRWRT
jgi:threonine dehydrogenase-like Zn-dependent dehydrogenase